ncbi:MAG: DUF3047 domain-containing protein [Burkholderiaceae bacterium]
MRNAVRRLPLVALPIAAALLAGCAYAPPSHQEVQEEAQAAPEVISTPWSIASSPVSPEPWQHWGLPGKRPSQFAYARKDGRDTMAVSAASSASMLRHAVRIDPEELGSVRFSWKVPELIRKADMAARETDDSPVRIVLAFEGDRSAFSPKNALLSELARALTGEPMPYATLMYVWCNKREAGSVILNPRTDRVRKMVVESGARNLGQWLDYERDIRADFLKAFGEEPGPLVGIGIMTDTDNTKSTAKAWYGPVRLARQSP